MLGDDVVDLGDPEARPGAQHPRFDARVFAPCERAALAASPAPDRLRWVLWAAKEAAYKLARQLDPTASFWPRRYLVDLDARRRGRVAWPAGAASVEVRRVGDAVHATATEPGSDAARVVRGVARLESGDDPSRAARELAVCRVAERLGLAAGGLRVERRGRIPRLRLPGGGALDLSLSHHGRVVAFACELDEASLACGSLRAPLADDPPLACGSLRAPLADEASLAGAWLR
jgi:phosphopantetheinyl transferase (holo-ACP synthase)